MHINLNAKKLFSQNQTINSNNDAVRFISIPFPSIAWVSKGYDSVLLSYSTLSNH